MPIRSKTDGGPQSASSKFSQFLKRWRFVAALSDSHYQQFKGHAVAAVEAIKSLVSKMGNSDSEVFCQGTVAEHLKAHG